jgi:hypothetical protein
MSSGEEKLISTLKSKFESGKTRNIYPRDNYNNLLSKIKSLKSAEKKSTGDYYNLNRLIFSLLEVLKDLLLKLKNMMRAIKKYMCFLKNFMAS